jgi:hypothetical protein
MRIAEGAESDAARDRWPRQPLHINQYAGPTLKARSLQALNDWRAYLWSDRILKGMRKRLQLVVRKRERDVVQEGTSLIRH